MWALGIGVWSSGSFVRSCQGQKDQVVGWLCAVRLSQRKIQSSWSRKQSQEGRGQPSRHGKKAERERTHGEEVMGLKTSDQGRPEGQQPVWTVLISVSLGAPGCLTAKGSGWMPGTLTCSRGQSRWARGRSLQRLVPVLKHCPLLPWWDEGPFTGTFHHHHPRVSRRKVLGETAFNSLCSKARRSTITTAPPSHVRVSVDCNGAVGLFFMRITYKHLVL